jgi:hypothetical protein
VNPDRTTLKGESYDPAQGMDMIQIMPWIRPTVLADGLVRVGWE